jgi:urea transport system permease protein
MALGLAIVFGLMGVINMAHGELMALGAYSTFVVQNVFRARWPERFDAYFVVALPVSFVVAALVGVVLERGVIRRLYGRPLETLLLTWGASLIIQQALRLLLRRRERGCLVADVAVGRLRPHDRAHAAVQPALHHRPASVSVAAMYWLLFRSDTGLRIRAVTQNRSMSSCLGVRAGWVDATTFALGAGLAGLAGCALTQIGNVGPSLGQNYIVDSFMVVVTGGVGKLLGRSWPRPHRRAQQGHRAGAGRGLRQGRHPDRGHPVPAAPAGRPVRHTGARCGSLSGRPPRRRD